MPARSRIDAQVATRVLRDLDRDMRKAIAQKSKGIGDDLVGWIKTTPGPSPYGRVYAKLGQTAKVRARAGRPPEVVVGGARKFSGGATVSQLARPYEYGSLTGDTKKGKGERRLSEGERAGRHRRHRRKRPFPQFPPQSREGLWINQICEDHTDDVIDKWLEIVDDTLGEVARG